MKIIISVLVFSVLLTGCVNGRFHKSSITSAACGGPVDGYTYTLVTYGNGTLIVIPVSKVHKNTEWRFYLYPIDKLGGPSAYGDSTVTIVGKAAGDAVLDPTGTTLVPYAFPLPTPGVGNNWINASGIFNSGAVNSAEGTGRKRYIATCVPTDVQKDQEWHFQVTIDDVGEVDPRGRIEK